MTKLEFLYGFDRIDSGELYLKCATHHIPCTGCPFNVDLTCVSWFYPTWAEVRAMAERMFGNAD